MAAQNESLAEFETKLAQLETLVRALEDGDVGLEDTVRNFEQGMELAKRCEDLLKNAELRVATLLNENGAETLVETPIDKPSGTDSPGDAEDQE